METRRFPGVCCPEAECKNKKGICPECNKNCKECIFYKNLKIKKENNTVLLVSDIGTEFTKIEELAKRLIKEGFKVISHHHTDKGMVEQIFE